MSNLKGVEACVGTLMADLPNTEHATRKSDKKCSEKISDEEDDDCSESVGDTSSSSPSSSSSSSEEEETERVDDEEVEIKDADGEEMVGWSDDDGEGVITRPIKSKNELEAVFGIQD